MGGGAAPLPAHLRCMQGRMALLPSGGSKRRHVWRQYSGTSSSYLSINSPVREGAGNWRSGWLDDSVSVKLPDMVKDISRIWLIQGDVKGNVLVLWHLFEASLHIYCANHGCDLGLFFSSLDSSSHDRNGVGQKNYYLVVADPHEFQSTIFL